MINSSRNWRTNTPILQTSCAIINAKKITTEQTFNPEIILESEKK